MSTWKEKLAILLTKDGNDTCADCGAESPQWSVSNIGVFVCINCAGIHRKMGVSISKVRSVTYDEWSDEQIQELSRKGNNSMNMIYEKRTPNFYLKPSNGSIDIVRENFIRAKYERKEFVESDDIKENIGLFDMPPQAIANDFYMEGNNKKLYIQLLGKTLHYYKSPYDSYSLEQYDVQQLHCSLIENHNHQVILMICRKSQHSETPTDTLFRLRSTREDFILIEWIHAIRRAAYFYGSQLSREIKPKQQSTEPLNVLRTSDLKNSTILGFASKRGGSNTGWKRRWWIIHNGILYYFKDNWSNKRDGNPKGSVILYGADIIWDRNGVRTGKNKAFIICTQKRTFYVCPENQNAEKFHQKVNETCQYLWNREPVDFTAFK